MNITQHAGETRKTCALREYTRDVSRVLPSLFLDALGYVFGDMSASRKKNRPPTVTLVILIFTKILHGQNVQHLVIRAGDGDQPRVRICVKVSEKEPTLWSLSGGVAMPMPDSLHEASLNCLLSGQGKVAWPLRRYDVPLHQCTAHPARNHHSILAHTTSESLDSHHTCNLISREKRLSFRGSRARACVRARIVIKYGRRLTSGILGSNNGRCSR